MVKNKDTWNKKQKLMFLSLSTGAFGLAIPLIFIDLIEMVWPVFFGNPLTVSITQVFAMVLASGIFGFFAYRFIQNFVSEWRRS